MSSGKFQKFKYNFLNLLTSGSSALPPDINDKLRDAVSALDCKEISDLIDTIQKKRWFGDAIVIDNRAVQICKIEFQSGVCKKYDIVINPENPVIIKPFHALFLRSEHNDVVSFRKNNEKKI